MHTRSSGPRECPTARFAEWTTSVRFLRQVPELEWDLHLDQS